MSKDKQRPHELKDASAVETFWIEPIINDLGEHAVPHKKSKAKKNHRKATEMRENKEEHQHTYKHNHEYRRSESNDNV